MNQLNPMIKPVKLPIYCNGGAGIGVGKFFENERQHVDPGYALLGPVYIDASTASVYGVPEQSFYKLPGTNGSGGQRKLNGPEAIRYTGEILEQFPPEDYNIVIHATTGGSGSTLGPSIVSELLARGKSVIVFCIGDDSTLQFLTNSRGTINSYKGIVQVTGQPVAMQYLQNGLDGTIEAVDAKIQLAISCLSVMLGGTNKNLDPRDVYNWSHFQNVTTFQPQVAMLKLHQGSYKDDGSVLISCVTLNDDLNNTRLPVPVDYQRVGVPMHPSTSGNDPDFPLHFALTDGGLDELDKSLNAQIEQYNQTAKARVVRNSGISETAAVKMQSNGLCFD